MENTRTFNVELIQKELINVELVEKQLIGIELSSIDLIPRKAFLREIEDTTITNPKKGDMLVYSEGYWVNEPASELQLVRNETPTPVNSLPSKRFETVNNFASGSLYAFLNGMKIHNSEIIEISPTLFEFPIDIVASDKVEVGYAKL